MHHNQLLNRVTQQLKQVSSDSKTPAGEQPNAEPSVEQKEAINQIFELFRFNYHNQFLKAFPDYDTMIMAKRLWARLLADYTGNDIMRAAERAVKDSSFLPSVHDVVARCDLNDELGIPSSHSAYIEACRATSPKKEFTWSHPIVYYAGRATDWFFIANQPEEKVYPVFKRNYDILIKRLQQGETLTLALPKAIPEHIETPLDRAQQRQRLAQLQALLE
ncbi:MAG: hypothetical protein IBX52_10430 [Bacterioplanes sp.]|nr:hypothetical protein [Bacterioplanes sp.]